MVVLNTPIVADGNVTGPFQIGILAGETGGTKNQVGKIQFGKQCPILWFVRNNIPVRVLDLDRRSMPPAIVLITEINSSNKFRVIVRNERQKIPPNTRTGNTVTDQVNRQQIFRIHIALL